MYKCQLNILCITKNLCKHFMVIKKKHLQNKFHLHKGNHLGASKTFPHCLSLFPVLIFI